MKFVLAFLIGVFFALANVAFAHDHPSPITCEDVCGDLNCKCWKKCEALGGDSWPAPSDCTVKCNQRANACEVDCQGGGS